jgi:hypothetical protein
MIWDWRGRSGCAMVQGGGGQPQQSWEATMAQFLSGAGLGIIGAVVLFRVRPFAFRRRY